MSDEHVSNIFVRRIMLEIKNLNKLELKIFKVFISKEKCQMSTPNKKSD